MKSGSSAIIIHNKKVLLFLRDDIPTIQNPNRWSLPGGQSEEDETFDQTIRRELTEEISYCPKNLTRIGVKHYKNNVSACLFISFVTESEAQKFILTPEEGQEIRFFSFDELKSIKTTPIIQKYIRSHTQILSKILEENYIPKAHELDLEE